ncbi:MAG: hypothetical protein GXO08_01730 [Aquificae bacterium]|nr:hypothetical protein [Aquificota bacterium]
MGRPSPFALTEEEARRIFDDLRRYQKGVVETLKRELKKVPPPSLHSLTTLQREANRLFGFSAQKTLELAQRLYEKHKVVSYPRTESRHLAEANRPLAVKVLKLLGREDLVPEVARVGKRVFDDSKLTDHHAIIPLAPPPEGLSPEERKIYELIKRRFLAVFYPPYRYEVWKILTRVGPYYFYSKLRRDLEPGWKALYSEEFKTEEVPLKEGDEVKKVDQKLEKRRTQPPPRYTEGSLLKEMERLGLGTPATRAQIIETLKKRGYALLKGKTLVPTQKAFALISFLEGSKVVSPEMTSEWERRLEEIHLKDLKKRGYERFLEAIKTFTGEEVKRLKEKEVSREPSERPATPKMLKLASELARKLGLKLPKEKTFERIKEFLEEALRREKEGLGTCRCGGRVVPFSKGWRCPSCGLIVWETFSGKRLTAKQALALLEGKTVLLRGLRSKKGKKFDAKVRLEDGRLKVVEFVERKGR